MIGGGWEAPLREGEHPEQLWWPGTEEAAEHWDVRPGERLPVAPDEDTLGFAAALAAWEAIAWRLGPERAWQQFLRTAGWLLSTTPAPRGSTVGAPGAPGAAGPAWPGDPARWEAGWQALRAALEADRARWRELDRQLGRVERQVPLNEVEAWCFEHREDAERAALRLDRLLYAIARYLHARIGPLAWVAARLPCTVLAVDAAAQLCTVLVQLSAAAGDAPGLPATLRVEGVDYGATAPAVGGTYWLHVPARLLETVDPAWPVLYARPAGRPWIAPRAAGWALVVASPPTGPGARRVRRYPWPPDPAQGWGPAADAGAWPHYNEGDPRGYPPAPCPLLGGTRGGALAFLAFAPWRPFGPDGYPPAPGPALRRRTWEPPAGGPTDRIVALDPWPVQVTADGIVLGWRFADTQAENRVMWPPNPPVSLAWWAGTLSLWQQAPDGPTQRLLALPLGRLLQARELDEWTQREVRWHYRWGPWVPITQGAWHTAAGVLTCAVLARPQVGAPPPYNPRLPGQTWHPITLARAQERDAPLVYRVLVWRDGQLLADDELVPPGPLRGGHVGFAQEAAVGFDGTELVLYLWAAGGTRPWALPPDTGQAGDPDHPLGLVEPQWPWLPAQLGRVTYRVAPGGLTRTSGWTLLAVDGVPVDGVVTASDDGQHLILAAGSRWAPETSVAGAYWPPPAGGLAGVCGRWFTDDWSDATLGQLLPRWLALPHVGGYDVAAADRWHGVRRRFAFSTDGGAHCAWLPPLADYPADALPQLAETPGLEFPAPTPGAAPGRYAPGLVRLVPEG